MIWVGTTCEATRIILDLKVTVLSTLFLLGTRSLYTGFNAATRLPEFLLHLRIVLTYLSLLLIPLKVKDSIGDASVTYQRKEKKI